MAASTAPAARGQTVRTSLSGGADGPPHIEGFTPIQFTENETFKEKFSRKVKQNPFVPIGCLATAGALTYGLRAFQQGKSQHSQLLMRGRIAAQGFTVVALVFGVLVTAMKSKE